MTSSPPTAGGPPSGAGTGHAGRAINGGYRLWTHVPSAAPPGARLPVLWVLDAATLFPLVSATMDWLSRRPDANGVQPMIVAGIDHDPADPKRRYRDYTFDAPLDPAGQVRDVDWGGGEAFAATIAGAADLLAGMVPADLDRQGLLGHSLAGQFALRLAARDPGRYRAIGAISPSIWWNVDGLVRDLEGARGGRTGLFIGAGSLEEPENPSSEAEHRRAARKIVSNARMAGALLGAALPASHCTVAVAADETHASAIVALLPAFLRFASAGLAGERQV